MNEYYKLTEIGDPVECQFPLRRKDCPHNPNPSVEVPPELRFMANAKSMHDMGPFMKVLSKYPDLRDRLYTALKDEGVL